MTGSTLPLNKSDEPRVGVYPGTFDPITNGHMDIVMRGCKIVDKLIIAVARNDAKGPLFSTDERLKIVEEEVAALSSMVMTLKFALSITCLCTL